jgi:hypothetical protein
MSEVIVKRPVGRPRGTTVGINERLDRYRISERCAEFTDEILAFWVKVMRNEAVPVRINGKPLKRNGKEVMDRPYTAEQQFMATDRLMDRAFGKAPVVAQVNQNKREMAVRKIEVRWLPSDPSDPSNYIAPEPD